MPELPDIAAYLLALRERIVGKPLQRVRVRSLFVLRTTTPPLASVEGRVVREVRRVGKRIAIGLDGDLWIVIHLMIAGRLQWRDPGASLASRNALAAFDFANGTLVLTEAGTTGRASVHLYASQDALAEIDRGGIDPLESDPAAFRQALGTENHTLKRALTDPRVISGIGNAYSDEILHAARLSPIAMTRALDDEQWQRLYDAVRSTLRAWIDRLENEARADFPKGVTAFRPEMAVHGRFRRPCPDCGAPIQRIRYADNETNYCARCQTGGRILRDRSLSRLLKTDWPKTLDDRAVSDSLSGAAARLDSERET